MTGDDFRHYLFHNPLSSWLLVCRWRCQQMLNWNRRVDPCLVNKFLAKYLPKPPGAVVMSYPLSRSPHLSQQLLPLSFSWVKTFEVGWLDSRGREGKLGREAWRRFSTSVSAHCSSAHPESSRAPSSENACGMIAPQGGCRACCRSCHCLCLHSALTGRQKVQLTKERSLQWEWSGYMKQ